MKKVLTSRYDRFYLLLLAGIVILVFPFLQADPHAAISISRDAFTDEGLNTIQPRNWVNYGRLDVNECDNFVKMPLFGMLMAAGFSILGTGWAAARITALCWTLFFMSLAWIRLREKRGFLLVFIPIGLFNYYTFQYLRFSMAESMTSAAILWSIAEFARAWQQTELPLPQRPARWKIWLLPVLSVWICTALKNQFAYLLPLWFLWYGWGVWLQRRNGLRDILRQSLTVCLLFTGAGLLYLLIFYLPFREALYTIMTHQTSGRFVGMHELYDEAKVSMIRTFRHSRLQGMAWLFVPALLLGALAHRYHNDRFFSLLSGLLFLWFAAEWHKFGIRWVPARYLLPLFWSAAAWTALVLWQLWTTPSGAKYRFTFRSLAFALFAVCIILEVRQIRFLYAQRSYAIRDANARVAQVLPPHTDKVVLGPWAPCLTWQSGSLAVPVWRDFLNGSDFDTRYQPAAWVSERDQGDNDGAFAAKGIEFKGARLDSFYIRDRWIYFLPAE